MADQWAEFAAPSEGADPYAEFTPAGARADPVLTQVGSGPLATHPDYATLMNPWEYGLSLGQGPRVGALAETLREGNVSPTSQFASEAPGTVSVNQPMDFASRYQRNLGRLNAQRDVYNAQNPLAPLEEVAGTLPYSLLASEATPGLAALRGMGLAGRVGAGMIEGGEAGAIGTPVTGGSLGQNVLTGMALGGALPAVGSVIPKATILPGIDPEVAKAAQAAAQQGVNVRPGQIALSKNTQNLDKFFAGGYDTDQLKAVTRATSRLTGADTEAFNSAALDAQKKVLGQGFDNVALQTPRMAYGSTSDPFHQALQTVNNSLGGLKAADRQQVQGVLKEIVQRFGANGGWIDGKTFQQMTRYNSSIGNLTSSSNSYEVRQAGYAIKSAMYDLLDRNAPAGLRGQLADLKSKYANALVVEPVVDAAGPSGLIDPKKLFNVTKNMTPGTDLHTLGQVGKYLPSPDPAGAAKAVHASPWLKAVAAGEAPFAAYEAFQHPEVAGAAALGASAAYGGSKLVGAIMASERFRQAALNNALSTPGAPGIASRMLTPGLVGGVNLLNGTQQSSPSR